MTDIVRQWASGSWANNGFLLADTDFGGLGLIALVGGLSGELHRFEVSLYGSPVGFPGSKRAVELAPVSQASTF